MEAKQKGDSQGQSAHNKRLREIRQSMAEIEAEVDVSTLDLDALIKEEGMLCVVLSMYQV